MAEADTTARVVGAATATGLRLRGVLHAAAVVEDATLANITDELIDRDWAPKVYGSWHLHRDARRASRWTGSAFSRRLPRCSAHPVRAHTRGQQLGGRIFSLAPRSGPAGRRDRVGCMGRGRTRHVPGGRRRNDDRPRRGCVCVRDTPAPQPRLHRLRPIIGTPWLPDLVARSPFAEIFNSLQRSPTGPSTLRNELSLLRKTNGRPGFGV